MNHEGERFLHQKDSGLQRSLAVELEQIRREQAGEEPETKPAEKIADWLRVVERTHMGHDDDPRVKDRIKASYHRDYVIDKDHIPESVYHLEARIAREQGHGDIPITDEYRERKASEIIASQEDSLDRWVDYLTSPDATYPTWAKYWAFTSMVKMGKFEKTLTDEGREHARFARRTEDTVAPFPPLNARALSLSIGAIESRVAEKALPKSRRTGIENTSTRLDDPEFNQLVGGESFSKLYTQFLIELPAYSPEGLKETRGEWVKYDQGSDPTRLVESLAGHPLEWCTADLSTAKTQLEGGDFYVYYSQDELAQPTIPRVAIRMNYDQIAEVRGIAPSQNIDPYISEVVAEKMKSFPDGESYMKRSADMARVTEIEGRVTAGQPLNTSDLRFLYQIDAPIDGFGYDPDPRIDTLLEGRSVKQDLAAIFDTDESRIGLTPDDVLEATEPLVYYHGDLSLGNLTSAEGLTLPQSVGRDVYLASLISAEGLTLPQSVGDNVDLASLTSAEGLRLPQKVGGGVYLSSLTSAEGLTLPQSVGGGVHLNSLTSAEGLILPQDVGGYLYLSSLALAEGLKLPERVRDYVILANNLSENDKDRLQNIYPNLFFR